MAWLADCSVRIGSNSLPVGESSLGGVEDAVSADEEGSMLVHVNGIGCSQIPLTTRTVLYDSVLFSRVHSDGLTQVLCRTSFGLVPFRPK